MINNVDGLFELLFQDRLTVHGKRKLQETFKQLQQENQQLKEENSIIYCQLEEMQMNKTDNTKVNILEMKLQQRDEVFDKAINYLKRHAVYDEESYCNFADMLEQDECYELLDILNKGRKSHD